MQEFVHQEVRDFPNCIDKVRVGDDVIVRDRYFKNPVRGYIVAIHSFDGSIATAKGLVDVLGYNGRRYEALYWIHDPKHKQRPDMMHAPDGVWEVAPVTKRLVEIQRQMERLAARLDALDGKGGADVSVQDSAVMASGGDGESDNVDDGVKLGREELLAIAAANGISVKPHTPTYIIRRMLENRDCQIDVSVADGGVDVAG